MCPAPKSQEADETLKYRNNQKGEAEGRQSSAPPLLCILPKCQVQGLRGLGTGDTDSED